MRIQRQKDGTALVVRRRKGKTYAAVFSADLDDRQIESRVRQGEAAFFPYNKRTGEIRWDQASRPIKFRR